MELVRRSRVTTICKLNPEPKGLAHATKLWRSKSSSVKWQVTVPKNRFNVVICETFEDSTSVVQDLLPCQRVAFLNFATGFDLRIDELRINFQDYRHVTVVEFSGHIDSIITAFEVVSKFENCNELRFTLNDDNILAQRDEVLFPNIWNSVNPVSPEVKTLVIHQDFTVCEKRFMDMQNEDKKMWRLDEIFHQSRLYLPNVIKLDVYLLGIVKNYEKVKEFVDTMPALKDNFNVEIIGERVKVRQKDRAHSHRMAGPSHRTRQPSAEYRSGDRATQQHNGTASSVNRGGSARDPEIQRVDLSIVKKEMTTGTVQESVESDIQPSAQRQPLYEGEPFDANKEPEATASSPVDEIATSSFGISQPMAGYVNDFYNFTGMNMNNSQYYDYPNSYGHSNPPPYLFQPLPSMNDCGNRAPDADECPASIAGVTTATTHNETMNRFSQNGRETSNQHYFSSNATYVTETFQSESESREPGTDPIHSGHTGRVDGDNDDVLRSARNPSPPPLSPKMFSQVTSAVNKNSDTNEGQSEIPKPCDDEDHDLRKYMEKKVNPNTYAPDPRLQRQSVHQHQLYIQHPPDGRNSSSRSQSSSQSSKASSSSYYPPRDKRTSEKKSENRSRSPHARTSYGTRRRSRSRDRYFEKARNRSDLQDIGFMEGSSGQAYQNPTMYYTNSSYYNLRGRGAFYNYNMDGRGRGRGRVRGRGRSSRGRRGGGGRSRHYDREDGRLPSETGQAAGNDSNGTKGQRGETT